MQSQNITSSLIIGLIDGIRSTLILAATMTFLQISQQRFQWIFAVYILISSLILAFGHWFTIRSENRSATGEALQKEKEIYQNIGLTIEDDDTPHRQPQFTQDAITPSIRVGLLYILGGVLVFLPFLFFAPFEKALLLSFSICIPLLAICGYAKAMYYKVPVAMEIIRTTLLPIIAISLLYGIIKLLA